MYFVSQENRQVVRIVYLFYITSSRTEVFYFPCGPNQIYECLRDAPFNNSARMLFVSR
jgi:hypothetical protein